MKFCQSSITRAVRAVSARRLYLVSPEEREGVAVRGSMSILDGLSGLARIAKSAVAMQKVQSIDFSWSG